MMKKLMLALLLVLSLVSIPVMAEDGSNYEVETIYVDGIGYLEHDGDADAVLNVERGDDSLPISVTLYGTGETVDIQITAELYGYEDGLVETQTATFDIEDGVWYRETLYLEIPDDIDEGVYTLYVRVSDSVSQETYTANLYIEPTRHDVRVYDVLVDDAEAGDYVSVEVRLENMGDLKEEDIKVTVSNEALGVETSTYLDELDNRPEVSNEDEEDSGDVTLTFQVPEDAAEGDYTLTVSVEYDRGEQTTEGSVDFHVDADEDAEDEGDSTVTVVVDDEADDDVEDEEETDFSTALRLGFGILAVLIVILALILIVRR